MATEISELLKTIGEELCSSETDSDGCIRAITNDEQLVRLLWKRALGYEEIIHAPDGTLSHRKFDPDPKAQQFIIERREGKFVAPQEGSSMSVTDRVEELLKQKINEAAEAIAVEKNDSDV